MVKSSFIKVIKKLILPIIVILSLISIVILINRNDREIINTLNIETIQEYETGQYSQTDKLIETASGKIVDKDGMTLGLRFIAYMMIPLLIISIYKISKTED